MNYLTNYYKNLCEQLQARVYILEAGLRKAMESGDAAIMRKELARQKARRQLKQDLGTRAGLRAQQLQTRDPDKAGLFQGKSDEAKASARELLGNIEEIEMQLDLDPTLRNRTTGSYQY